MTDSTPTGDGDQVPTLQQLIRSRMDQHGWSYADLAKQSGDRLTRSRWQQLGTGTRMKSWPEPATVRIVVETLGFDYATVVLAAAKSLELPVDRRGTLLSQLLPAGTDLLSDEVVDGVLALLRSLVADALQREDLGGTTRAGEDRTDGPLVGFSLRDAPSSRRNALRRSADSE